jgi:hypothetical protein
MKATIANLPSDISKWSFWFATYHFATRKAAAFEFVTEKPELPKAGGAEFCGEVSSAEHGANISEVFFLHNILWRVCVVDTRENRILKIKARSVASLQDLIELVPIP